jgi:hypothetical protein
VQKNAISSGPWSGGTPRVYSTIRARLIKQRVQPESPLFIIEHSLAGQIRF